MSFFSSFHRRRPRWRSTTVLAVRRGDTVAVGADGQVSLGDTVVKGNASKVRRLKIGGREILAGFAGGTADAFALLDRLEGKLEANPVQLSRACVELAKDWRTDRYLRRLEAMLVVADASEMYLVSGTGDVVEPEHGMIGIGSGGLYALAAARALADGDLDAEGIVRRGLEIAADICVYTNNQLIVEVIGP